MPSSLSASDLPPEAVQSSQVYYTLEEAARLAPLLATPDLIPVFRIRWGDGLPDDNPE